MFDALAQLMPHGLLCSCAWPSRSSAVAVISDSRYAIPPGPENCEATGPKYRAAEELNKNRIQWLKNIWKLLFFYLHLDMCIYIYMLIVSTAPYLLTWDISIYLSYAKTYYPFPWLGLVGYNQQQVHHWSLAQIVTLLTHMSFLKELRSSQHRKTKWNCMELEDEKHKGKETEMWEKAWRAWRNQNKVDRPQRRRHNGVLSKDSRAIADTALELGEKCVIYIKFPDLKGVHRGRFARLCHGFLPSPGCCLTSERCVSKICQSSSRTSNRAKHMYFHCLKEFAVFPWDASYLYWYAVSRNF